MMINLSDIQMAHETSKEKGFYDPGRDQSIHATKLALICTEIKELGDACDLIDSDPKEVGKELADIVIRAMDLFAFCGGDQEPEISVRSEVPDWISVWELRSDMYDLVADAVQADRKILDDADRDRSLRGYLASLIGLCYDVTNWINRVYRRSYNLDDEVRAKMGSNTERPRYHGRRY